MYRIYADGDILHNPLMAESGLVVIRPVLMEKLNAHGSLEFGVAPSNPLYDRIHPRLTEIEVIPGTNTNARRWFGRVVSVERGWNNVKHVYCEGELAYLCDSVARPFGFKGSPADLLDSLLAIYRGSNTAGPAFQIGNVSVTDPNDTIVRSSSTPQTVWDAIDSNLFNSSLGGYLMPRYDRASGTHYIDYLSLDENDTYANTSSQIIKFGKNLLDFTERASAEDVITVLIPFGATREPGDAGYTDHAPQPTSGIEIWDGNRITVASVNNGLDYIENTAASAAWGRTIGTKTWDDVTVPANLLTKAQAFLASQVAKSISMELSAVDLAFVDANIEQIQVGNYVQCQSIPHDLNILLLCTEKETHLTELENSRIILGAGIKTISSLQGVNLYANNSRSYN